MQQIQYKITQCQNMTLRCFFQKKSNTHNTFPIFHLANRTVVQYISILLVMRKIFEEIGKTPTEIEAKLNKAYAQLFEGDPYPGLYGRNPLEVAQGHISSHRRTRTRPLAGRSGSVPGPAAQKALDYQKSHYDIQPDPPDRSERVGVVARRDDQRRADADPRRGDGVQRQSQLRDGAARKDGSARRDGS